MNKITLEQLKEQQQISSLDEYTNMDLEHEADYQRFKDTYPKSVDIINSMDSDETIYIWNEYKEATNDPDDLIYSVNEIDEILDGMKPWDILRAGFYGDYRPCDKFFKFDGYGNLKSFDYPSEEIWPDEIAEFCIDNNQDFDNDEIREILDEEEDDE